MWHLTGSTRSKAAEKTDVSAEEALRNELLHVDKTITHRWASFSPLFSALNMTLLNWANVVLMYRWDGSVFVCQHLSTRCSLTGFCSCSVSVCKEWQPVTKMLRAFHELLQHNSHRGELATQRNARRQESTSKPPLTFSTMVPPGQGPIPSQYGQLKELLDTSADSGVDAIVAVTQEVLLSTDEMENLSVDQRRDRFNHLLKRLKEGRVCSAAVVQVCKRRTAGM